MKALFWSMLFLVAFYTSVGKSSTSEKDVEMVLTDGISWKEGCENLLSAKLRSGKYGNLILELEDETSEQCDLVEEGEREFQSKEIYYLFYKTDQCGSLIYTAQAQTLEGELVQIELRDHRTRICRDMIPGDFVLIMTPLNGVPQMFFSKRNRHGQSIEKLFDQF